MIFKPHDYQKFGIEHIIDNPFCGLFFDMGMGKTPTTLTAIQQLKYLYWSCTKVLVIAPKRVVENVWEEEAEKWDHLRRLKIVKVTGGERQRVKALAQTADVHVISRDNIAWMVANYKHRWPFDMVVIDESSSFKNHNSERFKALREVRPYVLRSVILTGTPASNHLIDVWAQIFLLDKGERLGETITAFRDNLFETKGVRGVPQAVKYVPRERAERTIFNRIKDICISFEADDYRHIFKLPKRVEKDHYIDMPASLMKAYKKFEREKIYEIMDTEITAINAAVLTGKLQQYANGFLYDEHKTPHVIHNLKLDAVEDLIEAANGKPVLLFYWYQADRERLLKRFKHLKPNLLKTKEDIDKWNRQQVQLGMVHPGSAGHGLNLQSGGHYIIWYGPIWSLELDLQANARLDRQGQRYTVSVNRIILKGTIDEDIMESRTQKNATQMNLIRAVKARVLKGT
jgi:SNF2 family DNA or RNA helicase